MSTPLHPPTAAAETDPLQRLFDAGRHEEALRASEQVLAAREKHDTPRIFFAMRIKGDALRRLGRHAESLAVFERVLADARAANDAAAVAYALDGKGEALRMLDRHPARRVRSCNIASQPCRPSF